jgi:hypothetical protein
MSVCSSTQAQLQRDSPDEHTALSQELPSITLPSPDPESIFEDGPSGLPPSLVAPPFEEANPPQPTTRSAAIP